ncbi:hypothetical protein RKE30_25515 [Streptomyces sp. Li-HN-5-11]|uniref:hypothetical protein n=1 Tax=Streptomyces sp. Li-HN-5-11 TaxID=3075432 RepID=UPI0028B09204|nr:hypothetical protein [Streptomyces sp. Li-HN-5-11]WNM33506.1 hypothetical protein RKE30_25515 [Streptomyces sp. Li-HN-5-11]
MDIAKALAVIDRLRFGAFPAERARTNAGTAGPGHRMAESETSDAFWEDDGTGGEATAEQYGCDRDGRGERLTERRGQPQAFRLYSVFERTTRGEDVAEPWASLGSHGPDVLLWKPDGSGRWTALGVSQWDGAPPFQLLAVVTDRDPP